MATNSENPRDETTQNNPAPDNGYPEPHVFRDSAGWARGVLLVPDPPSPCEDGQPLQQTFWSPFRFDFYPGAQRRFKGRLPELASLLVAELASIGSRFHAMSLTVLFEGERVCVAASLNRERGHVGVDVELEECLQFDQQGTLEGVPVGVHRTPSKN